MGFRDLFKSKYDKNLERLNFYISEIVNRANAKFFTPDCMEYLKPGVDLMIRNSRSTIEKWDASTNVEKYAYTILFNIAFDLLRSGKMHVYRGMLNPMLPCDKLQYIVEESLAYAVRNGEISESTALEQKEILRDEIACVG